MKLTELLPAARKLSVAEKMQLIQILSEDLETHEKNHPSEISQNQNPLEEIPLAIEKLRPFGLCVGEFVVPEDFDAPLPEDILNAFEGK
jgi:two-component sensor histidine kinase